MPIGKHAPIRAAAHHCTKVFGSFIPERASTTLPRQCPNPLLTSSSSRSSLSRLSCPTTITHAQQHQSHSQGCPLWAAITSQLNEQGPGLSRSYTTLPVEREEEVDDFTAYEPATVGAFSDLPAEHVDSFNDDENATLGRGSPQRPDSTPDMQPEPAIPRAQYIQRTNGSIGLELLIPDAAPIALKLPSETPRQRNMGIVGNIKSKSFLGRKTRGLLVSQRRKRYIETQIRPEGPPWVALAKGLERHTPTYDRPQEEVVISGSRNEIVELYSNIQNGKGHQIVPERPSFEFSQGRIMVTGPPLQMQEFRSWLEEAQIWATTTMSLRITRDGSVDSLPKTSPSTSRQVHQRTGSVTADQVMHPRLWTEETLYDYVRAVTRSRKSPSADPSLANQDVAQDSLIEVLFRNEATRDVRSMRTFHMALQYLCDQRMMRMARELIFQMRSFDFAPTVETYNILLRSCGKEQNFSALNSYLGIMQDHNMVPNDGTWLALLVAAPTLEARQVISQTMQRKGLHAASVLAREDPSTFVPHSVEPYLASGGDIRQYIRAVDEMLGTKWLNERAATHLVDSLATRGLFVECVGVLNTVAERWEKLSDKECLHKLLRHCVRLHNVDFAIWLLVYARTEWGLKTLDHIILNTVFDLAQSKRYYNLARTVWRYAAAHGELKYKMRIKVLESLRASLKPEPTTVKGRWDASMGAVVCGAFPSDNSLQSPFAILARERALYGKMRPAVPFLTAVVESWLLDREWAANGIRKTTSTAWKIKNAITIPLKPLTEGHLRRPTVHTSASEAGTNNASNDGGLITSVQRMENDHVNGAVQEYRIEEGEELQQARQAATA